MESIKNRFCWSAPKASMALSTDIKGQVDTMLLFYRPQVSNGGMSVHTIGINFQQSTWGNRLICSLSYSWDLYMYGNFPYKELKNVLHCYLDCTSIEASSIKRMGHADCKRIVLFRFLNSCISLLCVIFFYNIAVQQSVQWDNNLFKLLCRS